MKRIEAKLGEAPITAIDVENPQNAGTQRTVFSYLSDVENDTDEMNGDDLGRSLASRLEIICFSIAN